MNVVWIILTIAIGIAFITVGLIGLADSMTRMVCPKCNKKSMIVKNIKINEDHAVYSYKCEDCGFEEDKIVEFS